MRRCLALRVPMAHPGDASGVVGLVASGALAADEIVAILGKTEGNGCVNDFTRAYAVLALKTALAPLMGIAPDAVGRRIALVMSGGTEGGLSPHFLVLARRRVAEGVPGPGLAIGTAFTRDFRPEEIGRAAQIEATAEAVRAAMRDAGLEDPADVHFVQVKCPLLTSERIAEAAARGHGVATRDTYESMGLSRGASALGVGVALGEVEAAAALAEGAVGHDLALFSGRASASAGVELMRNEVVVLGNAEGWSGEARIAHRVMRDAIDLPAVAGALADAGLLAQGQLAPQQGEKLLALLAKAEPSRSGRIRGARHIMWDDSDVNATRHARALVGGVAAAVTGRTDLFISGGAEHQGPDGGGPVAVIVAR
jgi:cyanuric acid amidohydrolase